MFKGRLLAISVTTDASLPMKSADEIEAIAGTGLRGDRYAEVKGKFQQGEIEPKHQVTLIEREALDAALSDYNVEISHLDSRRNLLTEGVPLNHLVGKTFHVGEVQLRGVKLCEPCGYLEGLTRYGVEKALLHRGGLRAEVLAGGTLRVGDEISQPADAD